MTFDGVAGRVANSVDPEQMLYATVAYLGVHCFLSALVRKLKVNIMPVWYIYVSCHKYKNYDKVTKFTSKTIITDIFREICLKNQSRPDPDQTALIRVDAGLSAHVRHTVDKSNVHIQILG